VGAQVAVFEAVHGTAPDIAGKDIANPGALILAACMMLEHMEQDAVAKRVRDAFVAQIQDGQVRTRDLGGTAGTTEFTDALVARIRG
jgi:isocitrate dehydrogenase (NAD+)